MSMPVVCDLKYGADTFVETYKGFEIRRCYAPPYLPGQPSIPVYYEKTHPAESWAETIEAVRNWIDANLAAKKPTALSISVYPKSGGAPLSVTVSGFLTSNGVGVKGKGIRLVRNGVYVKAASTDSTGYYEFFESLTAEGTYDYYTEFLGDAEYAGCDD